MAPVEKQAPTAVEMPPMSAADKYKAYVRCNTNPSHHFDDNMKEPNNNKPDFNNVNFKDDAQHFFTCYTSYSCTPTIIPSAQTIQIMGEATQKDVKAEHEKQQILVDPNNNQLNNVESGKQEQIVQDNNVKNIQFTRQINEYKPFESSFDDSDSSQEEQMKTYECVKPAPHAELINVKNIPRIPSPLMMMNNESSNEENPRQRNSSGPIVKGKSKCNYGLSYSHSSPSISSKGSLQSKNESLVLHYFQNPHTYQNLQERQLPGQGPVPKSMLPPPAPPAPPANKRKPVSNRNSFNEKRNSLPNTKSGDGKSNDWEKVLTKFYQW